jgi:hypothetical protein
MDNTRRNAIAALVLALFAAALLTQDVDAQPDQESANFYVPTCQKLLSGAQPTRGDAFDQGLCGGLIAGLSYTVKNLPADLRACPPSNATVGQKVRVVLAYVEHHPQRMHEAFQLLVLEAWHEAWPCN